jgi:hypothetical protein
VAFYDRFRVFTTDLPSWSPWSALELTVQFFGYLVVGALWLWWPRRHVVVAMAAIALAVGGMGARAWAHHEADRAWGGTAVRPAAVLPFSFSASPVRMIPHGSSTLPEGVPSHGLGLRFSQDVTVVFDPNTHETVWVGSAMAVPARILR